MNLSKLIKSIKHLENTEHGTSSPFSDLDINSVYYNSKDVKEGGLFVAIKGLKSDGHDYIDHAISYGAVAIISETNIKNSEVATFCVNDSRKALAQLASAFYDNPSESMNIIGITGTNGKTTITYLIENILKQSGFSTGVIGTINYRYSGKEFPNPMTTPESLDLQKILFDMKQAGVTHVVMEVSSHAIDLYRIYNCHINTAVFTNLTQDHLDYHETMENYWDCKKRFFTEFLSSPENPKKINAVINCKSTHGAELADSLSYNVIKTGREDSNIKAVNPSLTIDGIEAVISTPSGEFNLTTPAIGEHNLENILNAVGAGLATGVSLSEIKSGIENFSVPGRLEKIENDKGISVFVDYAHTPDALDNVLSTISPLTTGKTICVFGCGGDRDNSKRPQMGEIAESHSDFTIITSDNPRTEDPDKIISHILKGVKSKKAALELEKETFSNSYFKKLHHIEKLHHVEPDRSKAINFSINIASKGDSVLIAGKGHETYQITNTGTIDFDDRKKAKKALEYYDN